MTFEPETATYDYHARRYDPTVARFTGPDAIRESISPYSYTENNPIFYLDPNGLGRTSYPYFHKTPLETGISMGKTFHRKYDRGLSRSLAVQLGGKVIKKAFCSLWSF